MPIYEFACRECDHSFEKLVRSTAALESVACPHCGGKHVQKQISTFAASVKTGSGASQTAAASACAPGGA